MALRARALGRLSLKLRFEQVLALQQRNEIVCDQMYEVTEILYANAHQLLHFFSDIEDVLYNFYEQLQSLDMYCTAGYLNPEQYRFANFASLRYFSFYGDGQVLLNLLRYCVCCNNYNDSLLEFRARIYSTTPIMVQNQLLYFYLNRDYLKRLDMCVYLNRFTLNALSYYASLEDLSLTVMEDENQLAGLPELYKLERLSITKQSLYAFEVVEILTVFSKLRNLRVNALLFQYVDLDFSYLCCYAEAEYGIMGIQIMYRKQQMLRLLNRYGCLESVTINLMTELPVDVLYLFFAGQKHITEVNLLCEITPTLFTERNYDYLFYNVASGALTTNRGTKATYKEVYAAKAFDLYHFDAYYRERYDSIENFEDTGAKQLITRNSFRCMYFYEALCDAQTYNLDICSRAQSNRLFSITQLSDSSEVSEEDSSSSITLSIEGSGSRAYYKHLEQWKYADNLQLEMEDYAELGSGQHYGGHYAEQTFYAVKLKPCSRSLASLGRDAPEIERCASVGTYSEHVGDVYAVGQYHSGFHAGSGDECGKDRQREFIAHTLGDFTYQYIHRAMQMGNNDVKTYFASMDGIFAESSVYNEADDRSPLDYDLSVLFLAFVIPESVLTLSVPSVDFAPYALRTLLGRCSKLGRVRISCMPALSVREPFPELQTLEIGDQSVLSAAQLHLLFPCLQVLRMSNVISGRFHGPLPRQLRFIGVFDSPLLQKGVLEDFIRSSAKTLAELTLDRVTMPSLLFALPRLDVARFGHITCAVAPFSKAFSDLQVAAFCAYNASLRFLEYERAAKMCFQLISTSEMQAVNEAALRAHQVGYEFLHISASDEIKVLLGLPVSSEVGR